MKENLEARKSDFIKNVSTLLKGIVYEKTRVVYDYHSDNFTMFLFFGKRNIICLDAIFTGKSNYFFGLMNEEEITNEMIEQKEYLLIHCKRLSEFMVQDLIFHFGENYKNKTKIKTF